MLLRHATPGHKHTPALARQSSWMLQRLLWRWSVSGGGGGSLGALLPALLALPGVRLSLALLPSALRLDDLSRFAAGTAPGALGDTRTRTQNTTSQHSDHP